MLISVTAASNAPDAASMWPVMDFTELIGISYALLPKSELYSLCFCLIAERR